MSDDDTILTTAELRAALAAALDDLEWRRTNEHAAARMIGETIAELLAQYELAVSGLRAAREKIAALEADAAALREIAQIARDYVEAPADSTEVGDIYDAMEVAVRHWKAST